MRQHAVNVAGLAVVAALSAASAAATDAPTLERHLRAARPDVLRWQTQPLDTRASTRADGDIVAIGRVAARTPVRYSDGHVAWFAVAGFRPVLVSTHALDARAPIGARDTSAEERDVLALGCEPAAALDASVRWRSARRLTSGAPLCAHDVERAPDVERDQAVTLTTHRGPIHVSRVLTSTVDAQTGERVRLRDRTSGVTLVAIVTGPGRARDPESEEVR